MNRRLPCSIFAVSFLALSVAGLLTGCAGDFSIRKLDPLRTSNAGFTTTAQGQNVSLGLVSAKSMIAAGVDAQRAGRSTVAAGCYLRALEILPESTPDANSTEARRYATARLVELCAPTLLVKPRDALLTFDSPAGGETRRFLVNLRRGEGPGGMEPANYSTLEPTDRYAVSNVNTFSRNPGVGATLIGDLRRVAPVLAGPVPATKIEGVHAPVTALATLGPRHSGVRRVALNLYDPNVAFTVPTGPYAKPQPLAADLTTPLAASQAAMKGRSFALIGFLNGEKYSSNAGLYLTQSPSQDKTPLIFVHGLISDPGNFRQLINALAGDPVLRAKYQVCVFYYPTSLPVPGAARLLRRNLAALVQQLDPTGTHPAIHRIVLVGHSMGGLLSRLMVSDSGGDTFYRHYFNRPIGELDVTPEKRAAIRDVMFFRTNPDVSSVVFIATPHRGSRVALGPLGGLGKTLLRLPKKLAADLADFTIRNRDALTTAARRGENSIFGLRPGSALVSALDAIPLRSDRARLHSVIGDRGRAGPLETSSDGVVPYRSSHLPQARRETVVPAGHSGTVNTPETVAEVARVLRENLDDPHR